MIQARVTITPGALALLKQLSDPVEQQRRVDAAIHKATRRARARLRRKMRAGIPKPLWMRSPGIRPQPAWRIDPR